MFSTSFIEKLTLSSKLILIIELTIFIIFSFVKLSFVKEESISDVVLLFKPNN